MSVTTQHAYAPAQVKEFDRIAIEERHVPAYELMCRAGEAVVHHTRRQLPGAARWLVLCGVGNNAGDGYVIARLALSAGRQVVVAAMDDASPATGAAAQAWREFVAAGGSAIRFHPSLLDTADVVIDALIGTGLNRPLDSAWRAAVEAVNASGRPVIAVDVPSGLDAGTGAVHGAAIRAAATVTFIALKQGFYLGSGPDFTGRIVLDTLGVGADVRSDARPAFQLVGDADRRRVLAHRSRTAHKGDFGHVLVVGGNDGMAGAVRLAAEAALRAGAGLVSVATRARHAAALAAARPELMCRGIDGAADLAPLIERATVIAIGPGLGRDLWAFRLFEQVLASQRPLVIDADALNLLAARPRAVANAVLTPHPGEAGRLLGMDAARVQAGRLAALDALASRYHGVVVLKGRGTLIGQAGAVPFLVDAGNPGMATGGMGDVLTGITAGLMAQSPASMRLLAAACAADVHARAADDAARAGERGLLAGDLFEPLRAWLNPTA
ncbi:MAG: NAD(P)H-hydrate dehydratase [Gammaproteobacteria bacterium]|nr:NAD(P)H-hydrate dehydratase [Gammaproteobacteria bacterium]